MIINETGSDCLEVRQVRGKTVESFRLALEGEISKWSGFAGALRKLDREAFDELMGMCRSYALESSNETNPIIFKPMVMSIMLAQSKKLREPNSVKRCALPKKYAGTKHRQGTEVRKSLNGGFSKAESWKSSNIGLIL